MIQIVFRFGGDVERAVRGKRDQRDHAGEYRVPVEDAVERARTVVHAEVGPERLKKVLVGGKRDAAHDVAQGRAEENA